MGTRALVHIKRGIIESKTLVTVYRQFDGYPEDGLGLELSSLADRKIVNGFGSDDTADITANGMECLAAQIIAGLKDGIGNVYVFPVDSEDCGEEYTYTLYEHNGAQSPGLEVGIQVYSNILDTVLFDGSVRQFRRVLELGTLFPEEVE